MIWARMFLKEQGLVLKNNILYQDNESSMKIIKNGKRSSGQKTKHMDNRYFWIKDRLRSEGIQVQHCPTAIMLADFFTKPLQGSLFRKFRDVVLGYEHISTLINDEKIVPSKERAGNGVLEKIIANGVLEKTKICDENAFLKAQNGKEKNNISWADIVRTQVKH